MIINILIQFLEGLTGIFLLTLVYYLASYVSGRYTPEATEVGEFSVYTFTEKSPSPAGSEKKYKAIILCDCIPPSVPLRFKTAGYTDCRTQHMVFDGNLICAYGCLGLGSCAKLCPNDAIIMQKGSAHITDACNGCGICLTICPKKLIMLVPDNEKTVKSCAACEKIDATSFCKTARAGYLPDFHNFPK